MSKRFIFNLSQKAAVGIDADLGSQGGDSQIILRLSCINSRGRRPIYQCEPFPIHEFAQQEKPIAGDIEAIEIVLVLKPEDHPIAVIIRPFPLFGGHLQHKVGDVPVGKTPSEKVWHTDLNVIFVRPILFQSVFIEGIIPAAGLIGEIVLVD